MARYTGPKWKISRRENYDVHGSDAWRVRPNPPGVHPTSRNRPSNYAIQFREKQKVKRIYGLLEKQFRNLYVQASKSTGNTGTRMLQLLELRLDNVVYRLNFAKTRDQARQFVTHGHVRVNGEKVSIPSYTLKVGDEITLDPKFEKNEYIKIIKAELKNTTPPKWLKGGKVNALPTRDMMDQAIDEQQIIEYYSR